MTVLEFRNTVRHYVGASEVVRAVDGVSLRLGAGEVIALYGPSGSGKSTLLMLAAGILSPTAGTVRFRDVDLASMTADELTLCQRRDIGFVYQSPHLMPGVPAVECAALKLLADRVRLRDARRAVIPWLARVGLGGRLHHTPEQLSGGERQRVAIARALVNEPGLLLLDEPTGNLDSKRGGEILTLISEIAVERQSAVLLVTHDRRAAAIASRVYELRDGALVVGHGADVHGIAG